MLLSGAIVLYPMVSWSDPQSAWFTTVVCPLSSYGLGGVCDGSIQSLDAADRLYAPSHLLDPHSVGLLVPNSPADMDRITLASTLR